MTATQHNTGQPIDIEAETAVIAALLHDPDIYDDIFDIVNEDDFGHPSLAEIYRIIVACNNKGKPFDPVTVSDELRSAGTYNKIGGKTAIDKLTNSTVNTHNTTTHAEIVASKAKLRQLINAGHSITAEAVAHNADAADALEHAEKQIFRLGDTRNKTTLTPMSQAVADTMKELAEARKRTLLGYPTSITQLDQQTSGLQNGQLIVIAGRPGTGKSGLGLQIGQHIACTSNKHVAFLSYEMSISELTMRCFANALNYDISQIRQNNIPNELEQDFAETAEQLTQTPLWIDDQPPVTISGVRSSMRRLARRVDLGCVIVDYLQLMEGDRRHYDSNRTQEVSEISRGLKRLAAELNCPIIALSQLNRQLETRPNKRPQLSDLRESGSIEQDASIVCFIYRDSLYNSNADPNEAELIIAKQRNGPVGTLPLKFDGRSVKFTDDTRTITPAGPSNNNNSSGHRNSWNNEAF